MQQKRGWSDLSNLNCVQKKTPRLSSVGWQVVTLNLQSLQEKQVLEFLTTTGAKLVAEVLFLLLVVAGNQLVFLQLVCEELGI